MYRDPATGLVSVFDVEANTWIPVPADDAQDKAADGLRSSTTSPSHEAEGGDAEVEGGEDEDDELAFQLRQAAEEKRRLAERKAAATAAGGALYVCPSDGAVWEWKPGIGWAPEVSRSPFGCRER